MSQRCYKAELEWRSVSDLRTGKLPHSNLKLVEWRASLNVTGGQDPSDVPDPSRPCAVSSGNWSCAREVCGSDDILGGSSRSRRMSLRIARICSRRFFGTAASRGMFDLVQKKTQPPQGLFEQRRFVGSGSTPGSSRLEHHSHVGETRKVVEICAKSEPAPPWCQSPHAPTLFLPAVGLRILCSIRRTLRCHSNSP
jgi:hypothetical protein